MRHATFSSLAMETAGYLVPVFHMHDGDTLYRMRKE